MKNKKTRKPMTIPGWLQDPDGVAPCICGRPKEYESQIIEATHDDGLKRWFHASCWFTGVYDWLEEGDDDEGD